MEIHGHLSVRAWGRFAFSLFLALALILVSSGAARADIWNPGDVTAFTQADWSETPADLSLLQSNYNTVYASTQDVFVVGCPTGFLLIFTGVDNLSSYLPAQGAPAPLDSNLLDPSTTASGEFGGEVTALKLNIDFSNAGVTLGSSGIPFGDLILTGFNLDSEFSGGSQSIAGLNGLTVSQFLALDNIALGGGSTGYSYLDLDQISAQLNGSFFHGAVTTFADAHLEAPTAPAPEPSSLLLTSGMLAVGIFRYRDRQREATAYREE